MWPMYTILQSANIQTQCVNDNKTVAEKNIKQFPGNRKQQN